MCIFKNYKAVIDYCKKYGLNIYENNIKDSNLKYCGWEIAEAIQKAYKDGQNNNK